MLQKSKGQRGWDIEPQQGGKARRKITCILKMRNRKPREVNGLTHSVLHIVGAPYVAELPVSRAGLRLFAFQFRLRFPTTTRDQLPRKTETCSLFHW